MLRGFGARFGKLLAQRKKGARFRKRPLQRQEKPKSEEERVGGVIASEPTLRKRREGWGTLKYGGLGRNWERPGTETSGAKAQSMPDALRRG